RCRIPFSERSNALAFWRRRRRSGSISTVRELPVVRHCSRRGQSAHPVPWKLRTVLSKPVVVLTFSVLTRVIESPAGQVAARLSWSNPNCSAVKTEGAFFDFFCSLSKLLYFTYPSIFDSSRYA